MMPFLQMLVGDDRQSFMAVAVAVMRGRSIVSGRWEGVFGNVQIYQRLLTWLLSVST